MNPLPKLKSQGTTPETPIPAANEDSAFSNMDQKVTSKPQYRKRLILAAGVTSLVAGAAYVSLDFPRSVEIARDRLTLGNVIEADFTEIVPINGRLVPHNTVYLDSVEGGRVVAIHSAEGEQVDAGAALVTLKNTDLELEVMGREAQYTEQLSNLARAQIEFDRTGLQYEQELSGARLQIELATADLQRRRNPEEIGTPRSFVETLETRLAHQQRQYQLIEEARDRDRRNSRRNLDQLEESVERMKSSLELLRSNLDGLAVTAPIGGQLSIFEVQIGEVIAPGDRVGQIDNLDSFNVRARVDEFYLGRVSSGRKASAEIGGNDVELSVSKVYPNIEDRQFEVDLKFVGNVPNVLRAGQTLRLSVEVSDRESIVSIPNGSYLEDTAGQWVFVVSEDGDSATRRSIDLGRRNSKKVEVLSGLKPGERVVTSNYSAVLDKVRITFN